MRLGILNGELGICTIDGLEDLGSIQEERIRARMPEGAELNDLVFFYMPDRDRIVINVSHALYEYYTEVISIYLKLSEEDRKQAAEQAPSGAVREAFRILDDVIGRRELMYGVRRQKANVSKTDECAKRSETAADVSKC